MFEEPQDLRAPVRRSPPQQYHRDQLCRIGADLHFLKQWHADDDSSAAHGGTLGVHDVSERGHSNRHGAGTSPADNTSAIRKVYGDGEMHYLDRSVDLDGDGQRIATGLAGSRGS